MPRKSVHSEAASGEQSTASPGSALPDSEFTWSRRQRQIASAVIAAVIFVVFMGPVTNPIATEELTGPIGRLLAPIHQVLYLSHGYRFFAPDPGPSHLLVYRLHYPDGEVRERKFPDAEKLSPRLRYHRWFMLSETLFAEHSSQPDRESFERLQTELAAQVERFARGGQPGLAAEVERSAERQRRAYERSSQRIAGLVQAVGRVLIQDTEAARVELYCQERLIPLPGEIALGRKLDDPSGLLPPIKIGDVLADGTFIPPVADAPAGNEEIAPQQIPLRGAGQ
ncbi:MAG: hypothetical protein ACK49R_10655 [Planctomycetota bacterium]